MLPESPIKIFAGGKFQKRKPNDAPAAMTAIVAVAGWLTATEIESRNIVKKPIVESPPAKPSIPSTKFIMFIIPTIQTIVNRSESNEK